MKSTAQENTIDPDALEQFLSGQPTKPRDKRRAPRLPYLAQLSIAPFDGGRFPEMDDFVAVHARDISTNGISFFTVAMPASQKLVLRLGNATAPPMYISARVARVTAGYFQRRRQLIVCCQFVSRLPGVPGEQGGSK